VICDVNTLSQLSSQLRSLADAQLSAVITQLYCRIAAHYNVPISCDAQSLATAAANFECCVPDGLHRPLQTYLLIQIRAALVPGANTDPSAVANEARCLECNWGNNAAMDTFLLCAIATALGA
jgi:hypothetical protein